MAGTIRRLGTVRVSVSLSVSVRVRVEVDLFMVVDRDAELGAGVVGLMVLVLLWSSYPHLLHAELNELLKQGVATFTHHRTAVKNNAGRNFSRGQKQMHGIKDPLLCLCVSACMYVVEHNTDEGGSSVPLS